jgi:hypothetical protein
MADNSIALGVQVPDAMKNISGMLNFAGQAAEPPEEARDAASRYREGESRVSTRRN